MRTQQSSRRIVCMIVLVDLGALLLSWPAIQRLSTTLVVTWVLLNMSMLLSGTILGGLTARGGLSTGRGLIGHIKTVRHVDTGEVKQEWVTDRVIDT
jgi:hypothetical protein